MKKKIFSFMMCLFLIAMLPLQAFASQEAKMIQSVWIDGDDMMIISADGEASAGEYQVSVDGQEVPVTKSNIRTEQIPMTFFCLVDTSGSISEFKLRLLQETLTEISNSMGEEDNMVIATLSNEMNVGPVLQTKQEREAAIAEIKATHEDTNLYAGIVQSFERLVSDTTYHAYGCVVVLSDGVDCQDNGMTEQEVMNAISAARLPLFTVALIQSTDEVEGGKILGSFARSSYGGVHQTTVSEGGNKPVRWDATGDEFGSTIWNAMQAMSVLYADLSDVAVEGGKTEARLDVTYVSGSNSYVDFMTLNANDLPAAPAASEAAPQEEPSTEPAESVPETTVPEQTFFQKHKTLIIIGIAATLLLIGLAVLLIIRGNKKKKAQEEAARQSKQDLGVTVGLTQNDNPVTQGVGRTGDAGTPEPIPRTLEKKYKVYMTDIPYGTMKLAFHVNAVEVVLFGRDKKRVQCVLSTADTQLSGKHFALTLQENRYCIRDEESKNGTYLNGVSIVGRGWVKLNSGDKVRAGAHEYRVIIEQEA